MRDKEAKKSWGCIFSAATAAALCKWQMMNAVKQTQPAKNGHVEKNGGRQGNEPLRERHAHER